MTDLEEARKWAGECCAWSIDDASALANERFSLVEEFRATCLAYGIEIGRRKVVEKIDWGSGIEEKKLQDLAQALLRNIESQLAAAIRAYPEHHRQMMAKALAAADDASSRLEKIHELTGVCHGD